MNSANVEKSNTTKKTNQHKVQRKNKYEREDPPVFHSFNALPLELKEQVCEQAMYNGNHFELPQDVGWHTKSNHTHPSFLPAICHTSKDILAASAPLFIRNASFVVYGYEENQFLDKFLASISAHRGYTNVKDLHFTGYRWVHSGNETWSTDLALAARCSKLQSITFTVYIIESIKYTPRARPISRGRKYRGHAYRTVDDLVARYNLWKIFECRNLKEFTFEFTDKWCRQKFSDDSRKILLDLTKYIETEFQARNDQVVSSCTNL